MKMRLFVVPGGLVERVLDGSGFGCRLIAGNHQSEAVVAVLVALATTVGDEIGHSVFGNAARRSIQNIDQQPVADEEARAGDSAVGGAESVDRDRPEHLVRALAAQRRAHEVLDGVHPGAIIGPGGSMAQ
jgi:hypothetical protein